MNFLLLILIFTFSKAAIADQYLIDEMESLKSSLEKNDPDRVELSLRLADVYFDVSIQEGDGENIISHRKKALKLYEDVLYGRDGLEKAPLKKSVVIKYQIARVLGKLGQIQKAKSYYHEVYSSENVSQKIKREAAFSLAEFYEEEVQFDNADKFYMAAIDLCESIESCNYAHYKRAWLYYKELKLPTAVAELKMALWDKNGVAREKIINDLLLFFSSTTTDGSEELAFMQDLTLKSGKTDLVRKLVESFYGAGNRVAGMNVLEAWNAKEPSLFYEARLLEENYGFRDWDKVRKYLSAIEKRSLSDLPKDPEEATSLKAMLKRVIVQIDSESQEDSQYSNDLVRTIDLYLSFYPRDDMREKLQQGWLKAASNDQTKLDRLGKWIQEDIAANVESDRIIDLRKTRLSIAQKLEKSEVIIAEAGAIAVLAPEAEKRRFQYIKAHEQYKQKNYNESLPVFVSLAELTENKTPDEWAVKSQNLALDIYNINKNYSAMVSQAKLWTDRSDLSTSKELAKEITQMSKVAKDAEFERVVSLGQTPEALENFTKFCFEGIYPEKSCPNAKVLSIKLGSQPTLVSLLEKEGDEEALLVEYERMGEFSKAAKLFEKLELKRNSEIQIYLKSALLYELGAEFESRDRILAKLINKIKKDKTIDEKWINPLYLTLDEAGLINENTLTLPWPTTRKMQIAERLQSEGNSKVAQRLIASQITYTGAAWSKHVLEKVQKLFKAQQGLSFYGQNSKRRFQRKVNALTKLQDEAKKYLAGADLNTRIYLLDMAKRAYTDFSIEIMSTPLPEGLTEEIMLQVQANLSEMSTPYSQVAADFEKLQTAQLAELEVEKKNEVLTQLEDPEVQYAELVEEAKLPESLTIAKLDLGPTESLKSTLSQSPNNIEILKQYESFFKEKRSMRLASYFTGRINSLKESNE